MSALQPLLCNKHFKIKKLADFDQIQTFSRLDFQSLINGPGYRETGDSRQISVKGGWDTFCLMEQWPTRRRGFKF